MGPQSSPELLQSPRRSSIESLVVLLLPSLWPWAGLGLKQNLLRFSVRQGAMVPEVWGGFCSSVTRSLQVLVLFLQTWCVKESRSFSNGSRPEEARSRMILIKETEKGLQLYWCRPWGVSGLSRGGATCPPVLSCAGPGPSNEEPESVQLECDKEVPSDRLYPADPPQAAETKHISYRL